MHDLNKSGEYLSPLGGSIDQDEIPGLVEGVSVLVQLGIESVYYD